MQFRRMRAHNKNWVPFVSIKKKSLTRDLDIEINIKNEKRDIDFHLISIREKCGFNLFTSTRNARSSRIKSPAPSTSSSAFLPFSYPSLIKRFDWLSRVGLPAIITRKVRAR